MNKKAVGPFLFFLALVITFGVKVWNEPEKPFAPRTVSAQSGFCNQSVAISVAAAAVQTIIGGRNGDIVRVCAFVITADTIATTAQFKSGSTNLTGAMRLCDECNISIGNGTGVLFESPIDGNLTITAATGAVTGLVRFGRN